MEEYKKKNIPKSLKENVWIKWNGAKYNAKCHVSWCNNYVTPFNFEAGHNIQFLLHDSRILFRFGASGHLKTLLFGFRVSV
jgi:hypothetical protein